MLFSLEALLALVAVTAALQAMQPVAVHQSGYANLLLYQKLQDVVETLVRNDEKLLAEFAKGTPHAEEKLNEELEKLDEFLQGACVKISARKNQVERNCDKKTGKKISTSRLLYDGNDFFEVKSSIETSDA